MNQKVRIIVYIRKFFFFNFRNTLDNRSMGFFSVKFWCWSSLPDDHLNSKPTELLHDTKVRGEHIPSTNPPSSNHPHPSHSPISLGSRTLTLTLTRLWWEILQPYTIIRQSSKKCLCVSVCTSLYSPSSQHEYLVTGMSVLFLFTATTPTTHSGLILSDSLTQFFLPLSLSRSLHSPSPRLSSPLPPHVSSLHGTTQPLPSRLPSPSLVPRQTNIRAVAPHHKSRGRANVALTRQHPSF